MNEIKDKLDKLEEKYKTTKMNLTEYEREKNKITGEFCCGVCLFWEVFSYDPTWGSCPFLIGMYADINSCSFPKPLINFLLEKIKQHDLLNNEKFKSIPRKDGQFYNFFIETMKLLLEE